MSSFIGPDGHPIDPLATMFTTAPGMMSPTSPTFDPSAPGPSRGLPSPVTTTAEGKDRPNANWWNLHGVKSNHSNTEGHVAVDDSDILDDDDSGDGIDWIYESIEVPGGDADNEEPEEMELIHPKQVMPWSTVVIVLFFKLIRPVLGQVAGKLCLCE